VASRELSSPSANAIFSPMTIGCIRKADGGRDVVRIRLMVIAAEGSSCAGDRNRVATRLGSPQPKRFGTVPPG
jgi:hypothetical protein